MVAWRSPHGGKRSAAAAAAPTDAATRVQAFVTLADDASVRGRLSNARKRARAAALAAAEAYAEQPHMQQQRGSATGSPTKRRRLGNSPNAPAAQHGSAGFQEQLDEDEAHQERQAKYDSGAANGELGAAGSGREQQLQPLPCATGAAAAGPDGLPQVQPVQQQVVRASQQAEDQAPAEVQPNAPAIGGPPQSAAPTAPVAAAGAAPAAVQRSAVTSLGDNSISALAPLSTAQPGNGQLGKSAQPASKRQPTPTKSGTAPSAVQKRRQQQQQQKQRRRRLRKWYNLRLSGCPAEPPRGSPSPHLPDCRSPPRRLPSPPPTHPWLSPRTPPCRLAFLLAGRPSSPPAAHPRHGGASPSCPPLPAASSSGRSGATQTRRG